MTRRQRLPKKWLIVDQDLDRTAVGTFRHLSRGTGLLLLGCPRAAEARTLRNTAVGRDLTVVVEAPATAARVHNIRELTKARLRRMPLILISPIYPTRSHPEWQAFPRMRAATLARLAGRRAIALGGMNEKRFRQVERLGFVAWAGIGAWLKVIKVMR